MFFTHHFDWKHWWISDDLSNILVYICFNNTFKKSLVELTKLLVEAVLSFIKSEVFIGTNFEVKISHVVSCYFDFNINGLTCKNAQSIVIQFLFIELY